MIKQQEEHYFLLFVNTKSGGHTGKHFLQLPQNRLQLKSQAGHTIYVFCYDLFSQVDKTSGLQFLLQLTKIKTNVNVIICGGDGTILWVVNSVIEVGVNPDIINFGIMPIGTGNDFSRSLGWGCSPINFSKNNFKQLKHIIQKWIKASKQKFDLWDIEVQTYKNGNIIKSSSSVNSQLTNQRVTKMSKTFSNYVGIGIDARVSYYFQKNRKSSKFLNLMLYGCLGLCFLFRQKHKMQQIVSQFSESQSEQQHQDQNPQQGNDTAKDKLNINQIKFTQKIISNEKIILNSDAQVQIKKGYSGIVCLNCTSYMSGVRNIFNTKTIGAKNKTNKDFTKQSFNDGKLQFVGFKNQLSLGMERFINTGGKLTQGQGPFKLKFKLSEESKQIHVQIDGQAFLIKNLKQIKITKTKLVSSGKINVLINKQE